MLVGLFQKAGATFVLIFSFLYTQAQKIECRNDSLFINQYYINILTPLHVFDSLLNDKAKVKSLKGKTGSSTEQRSIITNLTYKKLGIVISKANADSAGFSMGIKLQRNSNGEVDFNNLPTDIFKGELYIGGNYLNDKKTIEQLQQLQNCTLDYKQTDLTMQYSPVSIIIGKLNYLKKSYRLLFDSKTAQLTCIFVH